MTNLPTGWKRQTLEDVAEVIMGQSPPGSSYNETGRGTPFFQGKAEFGEVYPTVKKYTTAGTKFAKQGDILMSVRAPVGPTNIAGIDCVIGRGLAAIRAKDSINQDFLKWILKHLEIEIQSRGKGTTFDSISGDALRETIVALPPIPEQHQIVEILEDHLSRLDAALSDVKTATVKADSFRRSALISLVLGRCSAREEDFDNSECLSKIPRINDLDMGGGEPPNINLPVGWKWIKWKDAGDSQNGKAVPSSDYKDSGTRLLRPGNLYPNGTLVWNASNSRFLDSSYELKHPDYMLRPGNLVMNLTAQSLKDDFLGRTCLVKEEDESFLNQRLARLTPKVCSPEYALLVFTSPLFRAYVLSLNTGSLIQHMYTKQLAEFWLPLPPPATEKYIIRNSKFIFEALNSIYRQTESAISEFEVLKRSLLQAAFTGQLTREVTHV